MATIYLAVLLVHLAVDTVTMQQPFYIFYERSGGFAGMTNTFEINSDTLNQEQKEQLISLIDNSGFFDFSMEDKKEKNLPDQFQYKITIEKENNKNTLEFGESEIPDKMRPLIQYLSREARKIRR